MTVPSLGADAARPRRHTGREGARFGHRGRSRGHRRPAAGRSFAGRTAVGPRRGVEVHLRADTGDRSRNHGGPLAAHGDGNRGLMGAVDGRGVERRVQRAVGPEQRHEDESGGDHGAHAGEHPGQAAPGARDGGVEDRRVRGRGRTGVGPAVREPRVPRAWRRRRSGSWARPSAAGRRRGSAHRSPGVRRHLGAPGGVSSTAGLVGGGLFNDRPSAARLLRYDSSATGSSSTGPSSTSGSSTAASSVSSAALSGEVTAEGRGDRRHRRGLLHADRGERQHGAARDQVRVGVHRRDAAELLSSRPAPPAGSGPNRRLSSSAARSPGSSPAEAIVRRRASTVRSTCGAIRPSNALALHPDGAAELSPPDPHDDLGLRAERLLREGAGAPDPGATGCTSSGSDVRTCCQDEPRRCRDLPRSVGSPRGDAQYRGTRRRTRPGAARPRRTSRHRRRRPPTRRPVPSPPRRAWAAARGSATKVTPRS